MKMSKSRFSTPMVVMPFVVAFSLLGAAQLHAQTIGFENNTNCDVWVTLLWQAACGSGGSAPSTVCHSVPANTTNTVAIPSPGTYLVRRCHVYVDAGACVTIAADMPCTITSTTYTCGGNSYTVAGDPSLVYRFY